MKVSTSTVKIESDAYFLRMERNVFSLDDSSGAFSGAAEVVDDMAGNKVDVPFL